MPIRLNLLSEAQALEEMRRKDPAKRAVWIGVFALALVLVWSSSLQVKAMIAKGDLNRVESQIASQNKDYEAALKDRKSLADIENKLASLHTLACSRTLHGTALNALQKTMVDNVQLVRFKTDLSYLVTEGTKPTTNASNRVVAGKPATVTEKIVLTLEARDTAPTPGDQVNRFKQAVSESPLFSLEATNTVRLTNLSPPNDLGQILFTLECRYPERTR